MYICPHCGGQLVRPNPAKPVSICEDCGRIEKIN